MSDNFIAFQTEDYFSGFRIEVLELRLSPFNARYKYTLKNINFYFAQKRNASLQRVNKSFDITPLRIYRMPSAFVAGIPIGDRRDVQRYTGRKTEMGVPYVRR